MPVVAAEEVADLIRRTTEIQHELVLFRRRLELAPGPLAVVAVGALRTVESEYERAAETLKAAAPAITLVTLD